MSPEDYYAVLGVSRSANQQEIKKAYHKLAMQYHPDRNSDNSEAEKKFKKINEAYDVLKDEQKKAAYDKFGHNAFQNSGGSGGFNRGAGGGGGEFHDINDIFGDFFSDFMGGKSRATKSSSKIKGADLKYNITITLEEAYKGVDKNINFTTEVKCNSCNGSGSEGDGSVTTCDMCHGRGVNRMQQGFFTLEQTCGKCQGMGQIIKTPCKKCFGNGRHSQVKNLLVNIPAGIEDGTKIRLVGEGEAGIRGGNSGDLYIFVTIKPHEIYKADLANLHCRLPISFTKAALGGEIEVPIIEGGKVSLKIPAGTQNGDQLKLRGKGMSKVRATTRGDMIAHVYIEVPKSLTKKQRELLELLDKELDDGKSDDVSFFNKMKNLWS
jgi:molecular chaperone DnaJ